MIEEDHENGGFFVYCDRCSHWTEVSVDTWREMMDEIKAEGWQVRRDGDGWEHICPSCVEIAR